MIYMIVVEHGDDDMAYVGQSASPWRASLGRVKSQPPAAMKKYMERHGIALDAVRIVCLEIVEARKTHGA